MNDVQQAWLDFRQLFIAAHHNPIARRRDTDDYAVECREAFDRLDQMLSSGGSLGVLSPAQAQLAKDAFGGIAALLMPNQQWLEQAKEQGMAATTDDEIERLGGVMGTGADPALVAGMRRIPE